MSKNLDNDDSQRITVEHIYHKSKNIEALDNNSMFVGIGFGKVSNIIFKNTGLVSAETAELVSGTIGFTETVMGNEKNVKQTNAAFYEGICQRKLSELNQTKKHNENLSEQELQLGKQVVDQKTQVAASFLRGA